MWDWRRQWHPTPVLLPGKSHGWRGLVGCGPWGLKESDTTEQLRFHFSFLCIGEGNGNPLQYSCLENPVDKGSQWAVVHRVTKSRTRLNDLACMHASRRVPLKEGWVSVCGCGSLLSGSLKSYFEGKIRKIYLWKMRLHNSPWFRLWFLKACPVFLRYCSTIFSLA